MKRLLLLFLLSSITAYAQILEIQITEGQTFFGDSALTLSQIIDPIHRQSSPKLTKYSRYVIDVSNNHLNWYIKDVLVSEWPVDVVNDRGLVYIYILNPYYPGVLILNLDPFNETLVYSDKVDNDTRYIVYTKFTITNSQ